MFKGIRKIAAIAATIIALPAISIAQTSTPEIARYDLRDIAMVVPDRDSPTGAVILYNPAICAQIGAACEFFRYHEHGHVYLGHQFIGRRVHPMLLERDADHYAADFASPVAIYAAWELFMDGGSSSDAHTYGTPYQRANRLCNFAQQSGRWNGPTVCP